MKRFYLLFLFFLTVTSLSAQTNLTKLGLLSYGSTHVAGVWHHVDSLGNEYALVGAWDRLSIVDVTDPVNPVEVFSSPAVSGSNWREVTTWNGFAYSVSEAGGGVMIVDLRYLPDSIVSSSWTGDGAISGQLLQAHTIKAQDNYLYVFGAHIGVRGAIIADISNPSQPVYTGIYDSKYIHDGYIRNDTLYAAEINNGTVDVVDVSNKSNPVSVTTFFSPGRFVHNCALSDDGKTIFTTDEQPLNPVGAFDIQNIFNIVPVFRYYSTKMPNQETHNVRVLNDYLINPSYGSQLTICDASKPDNIVEIADYPTGFHLCWDADPYLPSGNILATDGDSGLFIFSVNYKRACFLEGTITDSLTHLPLNNVTVHILNTDKFTQSNFSGIYKTGIADTGTYTVVIAKPGYITKVIPGIVLSSGGVTVLNVELKPFIFSGIVTDSISGLPVENAHVVLTDTNNITSEKLTDANGAFVFDSIASAPYIITISKWGYNYKCSSVYADDNLIFQEELSRGYTDEFSSDLGWVSSGPATSGRWERAKPIQTMAGLEIANPGFDATDDCESFAFVTGNNPGSNPSTDDVDLGMTILTSPLFDLSSYQHPQLSFEHWLYLPITSPANFYDTLFVGLFNGVDSVIVKTIEPLTTQMSEWVHDTVNVKALIQPTSTMHLKAWIEDKSGTLNILEAGFDNFRVTEGTPSVINENAAFAFSISPNPFEDKVTIRINRFNPADQYNLEITDIAGRLIYEQPVTNQSEVVEFGNEFPSGLYFFGLIKGNNLEVVSKLIRIRK